MILEESGREASAAGAVVGSFLEGKPAPSAFVEARGFRTREDRGPGDSRNERRPRRPDRRCWRASERYPSVNSLCPGPAMRTDSSAWRWWVCADRMWGCTRARPSGSSPICASSRGMKYWGTSRKRGETFCLRHGVDIGDRVLVEFTFGCGFCKPCLTGESRLCKMLGRYGSYISLQDTAPISGEGYWRASVSFRPGPWCTRSIRRCRRRPR